MYGCTGSAFVRHCTLPFLSKRCKKCSGRENVVYHVVDGQKRESRIKKETLQELFSDKRRLAVVCVLICCVIVAVIGGVFLLALQEQNRESASIQEKEQLRSSVSSMRDWTVEEGTRQVDYLDGVTWDDSVVEQVTFDDGEVDLSQTGTCELIDLITGVDGTEESCSYHVSVISREEAKEKAEEGSEVVTKDKGIVNRKEVPSSATSGNGTSDASRQDPQESSDAPQTSGGSSSGGGSSDSGSSGGSSDTNQPDEEDRPHVHTWVNASPEDSGFMDYAAECRKHGQNGGEPMFFRSINDFRLHQAADDCQSSWGTGFNGIVRRAANRSSPVMCMISVRSQSRFRWRRSSVNAACPLPAGRAIRRWSPGRPMCTTTRAMAIRKRNMIHTRSNRTASPAMRRRRPAAAAGVRWIRGRCTERSAAFVKTGVPCKKEMCGISFSVQRI